MADFNPCSTAVVAFSLLTLPANAAEDPAEAPFISTAKRRAAVGSLEDLTPRERRAFLPANHFSPLGQPRRGDWLDVREEEPQSFPRFLAARRHVPNSTRRRIYLLPLGSFSADKSPDFESLRAYVSAFFQLECTLLKTTPIDGLGFKTRAHEYAGRQIWTKDILSYLRIRLPPDAFCLLGFTLEDLYPRDDWNFVFGQASLSRRVGIYSFARYTPRRPSNTSQARHLIERRSLKTMTHEIGHMFGVRHCVYYNCLMNGSNHLRESDARPLFLCPVCLRKMQHSVGFDITERYEALAKDLAAKEGFKSERRWIARRLRQINKSRSDGQPKHDRRRQTSQQRR